MADAVAARDDIAEGDLVCLVDGQGRRVLLRAEGEARKVPLVGVFAGGRLAGLPWGARLEHGSKTLRAIRPGIADVVATLDRRAQIVQPKDAARILFECDVANGARVLESGAGSGALTAVLAWAVAPGGHVTTYELREDFADVARRNVARAGLDAWSTIKVGDVTKGVEERDADAFILDVPNPWDAVATVKEALRADGHVCCYTPLVSQMEQTVRALRAAAFEDVRSFEVLERAWVTHDMGSRPEHEMASHTAFLTFARRA